MKLKNLLPLIELEQQTTFFIKDKNNKIIETILGHDVFSSSYLEDVVSMIFASGDHLCIIVEI